MAIITITTTLRGFQAATRSVRRLSANFRRLGQRVGQVGRALSLRMTAPLLALGAAVLKFADTWQKAFRDIEVATGASGKELLVLQDTLRSLAKTSTVDVGKIADIIGTVNTLLGITGRSLEDFSKEIINVSQLLGEDAAQNARLFAKALNQFKVPVEEASDVLGKLFVITQQTDIGFGELLNQLLRQGPAFGPLNASLLEVADLMGRFNRAGLRARSFGPGLLSFFSKLGTESKKTGKALKTVSKETSQVTSRFISLVAGTSGVTARFKAASTPAFGFAGAMSEVGEATKKASTVAETGREKFNNLVKAIERAPTALKKMALASEAFGVDAAGLLIKAIELGIIKSFDDLGKVIGKSSEEISAMAKRTITLSEAMQKISNNVGLVVDVIGEPLLEAFRAVLPHVESFAESAREILTAFNELDPVIKTIIVAVGAFAVVGPPLLIVLGLMAAAIGFLLTPMGLVVAGLIALSAAVVAAAVFWDDLKTAVANAAIFVEQFADAVIAIALKIVVAISNAGSAIRVGFVNAFNETKAAVLNTAASIASGLQNFLGDKLRSLVNFIQRQISRIVAAWRRARQLITGGSIVPDLVSGIGQQFKKLDTTMVGLTEQQTGKVIAAFERAQQAISKFKALAITAGVFAPGTEFTGVVPPPIERVRRLPPGFRPTFGAPGAVNFGGPFRPQLRGVPGFQTGGSRVFTAPSLVSVAETGPERLTAEPLGGGRRGRVGNTFVFEGPVMFDELSLQKFGQVTTRVLDREGRRQVG